MIIMPIEFDDDVAQNLVRHDNLIIATVTTAVFTTFYENCSEKTTQTQILHP